MERPSVMKLRWPMRIFKIELSGSLGKARDFGQSETGVLPIDFQPGALRIGFDPFVPKHFGKLGHPFPVSGYSARGCLVRITIDTEGCIARVVTMHCHCNVEIRYAQVHRSQFGIELDRVNDEGVDGSRL